LLSPPDLVFFVYVDRTADDRPFYVGKGSAWRLRQKYRNKHWRHIADKHGWKREVIFATKDEQAAFDLEVELIAEHNTFEGWGANYSRGGEGPSGYRHRAETIEKIRRIQTGRKRGHVEALSGANHPMYGKHHTEQSRVKNKLSHPPDASPTSKLSWSQVNLIRERYSQGGCSHRTLAREFGVSHRVIGRLLRNELWQLP
jgi:hypothetical protein